MGFYNRSCKQEVDKKRSDRDFPGDTEVKTSPSKAGGVGLILDWGAKIPHASGLKKKKKQNIKQKQYCNKFKKDFKNSPCQKRKKKRASEEQKELNKGETRRLCLGEGVPMRGLPEFSSWLPTGWAPTSCHHSPTPTTTWGLFLGMLSPLHFSAVSISGLKRLLFLKQINKKAWGRKAEMDRGWQRWMQLVACRLFSRAADKVRNALVHPQVAQICLCSHQLITASSRWQSAPSLTNTHTTGQTLVPSHAAPTKDVSSCSCVPVPF